MRITSYPKIYNLGHSAIRNLFLDNVIIEELKTEARWEKALIHLKEKGKLEDSPRDIGKLFKEVSEDIDAECIDYAKEKLWNWAKKTIKKGILYGLPEWYKDKLAKKQFE